MSQSGSLKISSRGQMSLPAAARHRWDLGEGGQVGYIDTGEAVILVSQDATALRATLLAAISEDDWTEARAGFGDDDLASE